jgi:hypothetical protein
MKRIEAKRHVQCLTTYIEYPSVKQCAMDLGLDYRDVKKCCDGSRKAIDGYMFRYIDVVNLQHLIERI